jgi:hypothetical protein
MQPFATPIEPAALPATFTGNFSYVDHIATSDTATITQNISVTGNVTWTEDPTVPANDGGKVYLPTGGSLTVTYTYSLTSMIGNCTGTGGATINITPALNPGVLTVDLYGRYQGNLSPQATYAKTLTCDLNNEHTVVQSEEPLGMDLEMAGMLVFKRLTGKNPTATPEEGQTIDANWNFVAP